MSKRKVMLVHTTSPDRSPYEQGELDSSSPELAARSDNESYESDHGASLEEEQQKKSDKEPEMVKDTLGGQKSESEEEIEEEEDNDDGLLIKPPPVPVKRKEKHKHKHSVDKKKAKHRDKHRSEKDRSHKDRGNGFRDEREIVAATRTEKEPVAVLRDREPVRIVVDVREDSHIRSVLDHKQGGRDRERELKEKLEQEKKEQEKKEQEKREKSRLERERLERMEREKNRERKLREDRIKQDKENRRRREEEQRLERQKREREEIRNRKERIKEKERKREHSRSPEKDKRSESKQSLHDSDKGNLWGKKYSEVSVSSGRPASRMAVLSHMDDKHDEEKNEEDKEAQSSSDAESTDSETDSSTGNETTSDSDVDSSEEDKDETHEDEDKKHIAKSKFDEQSATESETESIHFNDHHDYDGGLLQDTPPMSSVEIQPELPLYFPAIQGCRNVEEFHCLNRIEEGTYGVVYRARDKKTGEIVALKRLKMEKEKEGFPITSLREINTLLKAQHSNIVTVREIVVGSNMDKIYIVMEYVEHDLKSLMECSMKQPFLIGEVKTLLLQLLRGVQHLHDNWIIHRDLKTSNLLLSHKGILKIGDFGLAREYGDPLKQYTPIVVTLWYRSPELLLGTKLYSTAIDLWSVGCIFAEFLTMKPIWQGKSEIDQLQKIFKDLGTPTEKIWPGVMELPGMKKCTFTEHPYNTMRNMFGQILSDQGFTLLNRFLTYNPSKRITATDALKHDFFKESPLPVDPSMFPTWPAKSEQTRKHASSPKPPSGGKAYSKLLDDNDDAIAGRFQFLSATKGVSASGPGFSLKF